MLDRLNIGCGENRLKGYVNMDIRNLDDVEIVHNIQVFPWPIPDNSFCEVILNHVWEHIEPKYRINVMDEIWRVTIHTGILKITSPYYLSFGACQDPTHYTCPNEKTFTYFDVNFSLYGIYKPKPWKLIRNSIIGKRTLKVTLMAIK